MKLWTKLMSRLGEYPSSDLPSERSLVKHGRRSFWLKYDWARALRLRTLKRIRREVRINNDIVRRVWNDLWAMKMHMTDKGSCHPAGRWNEACRDRLPRSS